MLKLCKDCKHVRRDSVLGYAYAKCAAPVDGNVNPVTGGPVWFCSTERNAAFNSINECGSKGRLWEAKPPSFASRLWKWLFSYLNCIWREGER